MHSMPKRAHTVALATPCWPAPVSATMRRLPSRRASSAWPTALLILCAPVWARSSRLSQMRAPPTSAREPLGEVERRLAADVVAPQRGELGRERRVGERVGERGLELVERRHHRLGHEAPAEAAEAPERVGRVLHVESALRGAHPASLAAATSRRTRSWSLMPAALLDAARAVDAVGAAPRAPPARRSPGRAARRAAACRSATSPLARRQWAYSASMSRVSPHGRS